MSAPGLERAEQLKGAEKGPGISVAAGLSVGPAIAALETTAQ